jgi:hypothetical protein
VFHSNPEDRQVTAQFQPPSDADLTRRIALATLILTGRGDAEARCQAAVQALLGACTDDPVQLDTLPPVTPLEVVPTVEQVQAVVDGMN